MAEPTSRVNTHQLAVFGRQLDRGRGAPHASRFLVRAAGRPKQEHTWRGGDAGRRPLAAPTRAPLWSPLTCELHSASRPISLPPVLNVMSDQSAKYFHN